jgi:hypothetical protein
VHREIQVTLEQQEKPEQSALPVLLVLPVQIQQLLDQQVRLVSKEIQVLQALQVTLVQLV